MTRMTPARWLAAAATDPQEVLRGWKRGTGTGIAMLPRGVTWDAIVVQHGAGQQVVEMLDADAARGPVLTDSVQGRSYFLVPTGTAARWSAPDTTALGARFGWWIGVPAPGLRTVRAQWTVPPDGRGTLTDPAALREAIVRLVQEHGSLEAAATARRRVPEMQEHHEHDAPPGPDLLPVPPQGLAARELRASWQLPDSDPDVDVSTVAATHAAVAFAYRWSLGITAGVLLGGLAARLVQHVQEATAAPSGMRLVATLVPGDVATVAVVLPQGTPPGDLSDVAALHGCAHVVGHIPSASGPMYFAALRMADAKTCAEGGQRP
jgi:hypothetical protein